MRELRITSSFYNLSNPPSTGSAVYHKDYCQVHKQKLLLQEMVELLLNKFQVQQSQRRGERLNVGQIDTLPPDIPVDTTPPVVEIPPTVVDVVPPTIFVPPVIQHFTYCNHRIICITYTFPSNR